MIRPRLIPCLLLHRDGCVKTVRFKNPTYLGDPINIARIFNDREVDELVVLDIDATRDNRRPNFTRLRDLASECFMPVGYGGGIRSLEDIESLFSIGVEKTAINSCALENPQLVDEAARTFGSQSIVAAIDVKKDFFGRRRVVSHGGRRGTGRDPVTHAREMERRGAGEIFLNSVDCDGTREGYDIELIRSVAAAVGIPVVACGGAGRLEHAAAALRAGAAAAAAGSLFSFAGPHRAVLISYPDSTEIREQLGSLTWV